MDKRKTIAGVVAIAILAFGAWFFFWREVKDPQVAALEQQRDADFARQAQMSEPERRSSREEFGKKMQGLSPEQRQKFMESSMPIMLKMFEAQIDRFEAMSPDEQRKEMDKRIDEMKARGQNGPGGGGGGAGGNGPRPTGQQIDQWRKKMLDWTTPEQRAKFDTAIQKFNKRLEERGMNPVPGGGFF